MPSSAESLVLGRLGVGAADPDIRRKLFQDTKTHPKPVQQEDITLLDQLLGADKREPVVDPFREAERLRTNKDENKPVNEGEVPVIDDSDTTTLDKLF